MILFSAVNPFRICCPTGNVDDLILDIEKILTDLDGLHEISDPNIMKAQKEHKKQQLEKAYGKILNNISPREKTHMDKNLALLLGDVVRRYGRLCYDENFVTCKQVMLAAVNAQLYGIGCLTESIDFTRFASLQKLKDEGSANHHLFAFMDEMLVTLDHHKILANVLYQDAKNEISNDQIYNLGTSLRWLGHCYQNIDKFLDINPENNARFKHIYYGSESLLKLANNEKFRKELAELYYNSWYFLFKREFPNDIEGGCAVYNNVLKYTDDLEMTARIANMRFVILRNAGLHEKAEVYLRQALAIRESMPENKQTAILLANLRNSYAKFLFDQPNPDLEMARKYNKMALHYSDACRANGEYNVYFAFYEKTAAEICKKMGLMQEANTHIDNAIKVHERYKEIYHDSYEEAKLFKTELQPYLKSNEKHLIRV